MKPDPKSILAIVVLSLATWTLFYVNGMPLDAAPTFVVVTGTAILVFAVKSTVQNLQRKKSKEDVKK
jgi:hypothetical protein